MAITTAVYFYHASARVGQEIVTFGGALGVSAPNVYSIYDLRLLQECVAQDLHDSTDESVDAINILSYSKLITKKGD